MVNRQNILKLAKGVIAAYVISVGLLALLALLMWKWNLSDMWINGAMLAIYILSTAVGGFYMGKKQREKKFLWGMVLGFLYVAILFIAAALLNGPEGLLNGRFITIAFICILSGMLGGMVA